MTRNGAARQGFSKTFAVPGADPGQLGRDFRVIPAPVVAPVPESPGLFAVQVPLTWLGTAATRSDTFAAMAATFDRISEIARRRGGYVLPPGLGTTQHRAPLAGDTHVLEVLSSVEQEVLCNLLRTQVPTLITLFGRGRTVAGAPRDRVGSRWLAGSGSHLATRFLASTTPAHLERVKAELRRRDGVALLDRMDIHPGTAPDGSMTVVVRCLDSAATLAGLRAQALLLAASAMQARRMVRDGRRIGNVPQRMLEDNRARAVADGLRAQLATDDKRSAPRTRNDRSPHGGHRQAEGAGVALRPARIVARSTLRALAVELRNLDVDATELAPVLLPLELPGLGVERRNSESDLLARWAMGGDRELTDRVLAGLTDPAPGGPLLSWVHTVAPNPAAITLGAWQDRIRQARLLQSGGRRSTGSSSSGGRKHTGRPDRNFGDQRRGGARPQQADRRANGS
ncbi:hypothetical protein [Nocardia sp. NPDC057353]|uniref:hypothetical protein n=1 Tax=Nocardia sp. NPDC057353 TaxID=3346104 RepID=UPI00362B3C0C